MGSGSTTSVVISVASSSITFVSGVEVVIGGSTVARGNINKATNTLSTTGTLKTALTGADMTTVVIETASGVAFVTTADTNIGSTNVALANINTATNNGATTSVVVQATTGVSFDTTADIMI